MIRLEIDHVRKVHRGGVVANDDITFDVVAGEVMGLLGPNGAGKTTLLRQCLGLTRPTSGAIRVNGRDVVANAAEARSACSYQPQIQAPPWGLKPRRAVELMGRMRGLPAAEARTRTGELITTLRLDEWADRPLDQVSGGTARLFGFCFAVVCPGDVVILDEPTNDVDPMRRRLLWDAVRAVADAGAAVVLVTHNVLEAQQAVDRLVIIDHGRVVASGRPAELRSHGRDQLRLELWPTPGVVIRRAPFALPTEGGGHLVTTIAATSAEDTIRWCRGQQARGRIEEFSLGPVTLEDIYIESVGAA